MIRGTTPTLVFALPFDVTTLAEAWVTLSQNRVEILNKEMQQCSCNENKLTVTLTQEETLKLQCDCVTEIQLRVRTLEGEALASNIFFVSTERILRDGEI